MIAAAELGFKNGEFGLEGERNGKVVFAGGGTIQNFSELQKQFWILCGFIQRASKKSSYFQNAF